MKLLGTEEEEEAQWLREDLHANESATEEQMITFTDGETSTSFLLKPVSNKVLLTKELQLSNN